MWLTALVFASTLVLGQPPPQGAPVYTPGPWRAPRDRIVMAVLTPGQRAQRWLDNALGGPPRSVDYHVQRQPQRGNRVTWVRHTMVTNAAQRELDYAQWVHQTGRSLIIVLDSQNRERALLNEDGSPIWARTDLPPAAPGRWSRVTLHVDHDFYPEGPVRDGAQVGRATDIIARTVTPYYPREWRALVNATARAQSRADGTGGAHRAPSRGGAHRMRDKEH